jgi:hypothetical protein
MKAKKIFGVIFVISFVAVVASSIALNAPTGKLVIEMSDHKGVHCTDYTFDLREDPTGGFPDEPIGGLFKEDPTGGFPDEPIGGLFKDPTGGFPDEPIGGIYT